MIQDEYFSTIGARLLRKAADALDEVEHEDNIKVVFDLYKENADAREASRLLQLSREELIREGVKGVTVDEALERVELMSYREHTFAGFQAAMRALNLLIKEYKAVKNVS